MKRRGLLGVVLLGMLWAAMPSTGMAGGFVRRGVGGWSGRSWSPAASAPVVSPTAPTYPYSYYLVPPFQPARGYVGYGNDDFPFSGQPYGRPYDPWTWPGLSR